MSDRYWCNVGRRWLVTWGIDGRRSRVLVEGEEHVMGRENRLDIARRRGLRQQCKNIVPIREDLERYKIYTSPYQEMTIRVLLSFVLVGDDRDHNIII